MLYQKGEDIADIKASIAQVQRNQAKLMKKLESMDNDFSCYIFEIDKAQYEVSITWSILRDKYT